MLTVYLLCLQRLEEAGRGVSAQQALQAALKDLNGCKDESVIFLLVEVGTTPLSHTTRLIDTSCTHIMTAGQLGHASWRLCGRRGRFPCRH
jgi:hypothetical protein